LSEVFLSKSVFTENGNVYKVKRLKVKNDQPSTG